MKILIGNAWTFANGSLHIGHLSSYMPGDVIARYYRSKGDDVYFVTGTDCHGTAIELRAKQERKTPREISDHYHDEYCYCFDKLGFSFDRYGKTSSGEHSVFVRGFHKEMYKRDYIYEKEAPQAFCESCGTALADRFVVGKCPDCGEKARGDQCDACGNVLETEILLEPQCSVCGSTPIFRPTKHLFIAISKLEGELAEFLGAHQNWRKNAIAFTRRYINEGLRDRAITRDLDWGINVPKEGYSNKKIYVWAENVLGYLSMSKVVAEQRSADYADLWGADSRHYYVHGKDNIPFHTIILPSLMLANGGAWKLPDEIISSEFMTLEGRKISTSQNWAIWVKDIVDRYHPDSIRYFFIANGPERRDADFSWREYVNAHNGELLGAWGNFVNRTLAFVYKYFDATVPNGKLDAEINTKINEQYQVAGKLIEAGHLKDALDSVFGVVRFGNKYFDTKKPWETRNTDIERCADTIFNCVQLIANLAVLLEPFLPFSSAKIKGWLAIGDGWNTKNVPSGFVIPEPEILFERLDKKVVDEELERLHHWS
ncbi:MAG: methionine--tRNA ligase [Oscillospiraceae bacterium]|nr:methionine--tRNA ligase [Oscillospiraceae bacterium]